MASVMNNPIAPAGAMQAGTPGGAGGVANLGDGSKAPLMFDGGGSMPDTGNDQDQDYQPDDNTQGQPDPSTADRMSLALASVDSGLSYGRQQAGLPTGMDDGDDGSQGGQQVAGNMPAAPVGGNGQQTQPSGFAPLTPTANPFGKRVAPGPVSSDSGQAPTDDGGAPYEVAGNMPAAPVGGGGGPTPQTGFPPLAPTSNPFGQRTAPGTYQPGVSDDSDEGQA